jgi:excisionase family DNA binding protein
MEDEYVRPTEVQRALGVSYWTVLRWVREGRLQAIRLPNGQLRVAKADVLRMREPVAAP